MKRLLVTTAGGSGVYPTIEAVKSSRYEVALTLVDGSELAGALYEVKEGAVVPFVDDGRYFCVMERLIRERKIEYLMAPLDEELLLLSRHRAWLEGLGVKALLPDEEGMRATWDKIETYRRLGDMMPESYILGEVDDPKALYERLEGRVLLKPALSRGGRGIVVPEDEEEFLFYFRRFKRKKVPYLIQKLVEGREYNITTLHEPNGRLVYALARWKFEGRLIKSGSKASVLLENPRVEAFALKTLARLGLESGFNNVEVIENEEGIYLIEVNGGRIAAQDMNIVKAGVNYIDLMFDILDGRPVETPKVAYGMCNLKTSRDIWVHYDEIEKMRERYRENLDRCGPSGR